LVDIIRNGDIMYISWTSEGFSSSTTGNFFLIGNGFKQSIAANILLSTGSFSYVIESNITPNYGYTISVIVGPKEFVSTPFVVSPAGNAIF
jgi:hypothetical protein